MNQQAKLSFPSYAHASSHPRQSIQGGVLQRGALFYRQLKITWAKQLLLETDKTIAQISEDLGFVEDSYFVRIFKQETGETPLKYRKRKNRA